MEYNMELTRQNKIKYQDVEMTHAVSYYVNLSYCVYDTTSEHKIYRPYISLINDIKYQDITTSNGVFNYTSFHFLYATREVG